MTKALLAAGLAASLSYTTTAPAALPVSSGLSIETLTSPQPQRTTPGDVSAALSALPQAHVVQSGADGLPVFVTGDLGHVSGFADRGVADADRTLRPQIGPAAALFRLKPADLKLVKIRVDAQGNRHARFAQTYGGLDVVGGDLVIHVDRKGAVYAANGSARGGLSASLGSRDIGAKAALAAVSARPTYAGLHGAVTRSVYFVNTSGGRYKAYEAVFTGRRGQDPVRDKVYVDADSGSLIAVHPQIYFAEDRAVYSANNGTSLPGSLERSEGDGDTSDTDVNSAYDGTGDTYEAYQAFWNRDSYDNAGATLISSVHYDVNYCNAYWDSTQMVYGDGDSSQGCAPLARAIDVTGHELTHAVTENESGLIYDGESGGLNEALSDIFGAFTEAYVDGGKSGTLAVSDDTWTVGEDILPPGLRFMNDPAADGSSLDSWTSSAGNVDVHYSSGIANLAFYLLSQGGTHPRGKSTVDVTGVGMEKAIRIFYEAQIDVLTSSSDFLAAANATVLAAQNLGYSVADQTSVANAWQAVGVPVPTPGGDGGGGGGGSVLTSGEPVTGLSDSSGGQQFYSIDVPAGQGTLTVTTSGGTGDVDLYVQAGAQPTLSSYDCRPYVTGNTETCTVSSPAAGTYYIMLNAYATYSGVSLKATYTP